MSSVPKIDTKQQDLFALHFLESSKEGQAPLIEHIFTPYKSNEADGVMSDFMEDDFQAAST